MIVANRKNIWWTYLDRYIGIRADGRSSFNHATGKQAWHYIPVKIP